MSKQSYAEKYFTEKNITKIVWYTLCKNGSEKKLN